MTTENESNRDKNFEGGRVLEEAIDDYALDGRRYGAEPLRRVFEEMYGEQGVGWDVRQKVPQTQAELLAQNMGLTVLNVVVSPEGDAHAAERIGLFRLK